jgi:hypothetical protein
MGRLEEEARKGRLAFDAETVARWRWAILSLEAVRTGANRVLWRPLWVVRLMVDKVEHSLVYRIVLVGLTIGGGTALIVGLLRWWGKLG